MQSSSDAFSCLAVVLKLAARTEEYSTLAFFNSVKENKFFENSRTICNTQHTALYHVTKPELVEKQTMHKADLIPFEWVILTG